MDPLLPIVLDIDVHHYVRDHSMGVNYDQHIRFRKDELIPGQRLDTRGEVTCVVISVDAVGDTSVTLTHDGETRTVALGDCWEQGPFSVATPYVSSDEVTVRITYRILDAWTQIAELIYRICNIHKGKGNNADFGTNDLEHKVIKLINHLIDGGRVGLYPLKALLMSSNNWSTTKILRPGMFQEILLEGMEKGALGPDDAEGWEWLRVAADTNDPSEFMTDMERYYDLLASAAENGNTDALDIMNEIWPPEQIIEED